MCPLRWVLIFLSGLIAIFATLAAMANEPTEEEREEERIRNASMTVWGRVCDVASGRYLYRESKRLMPFLFSKASPDLVIYGDLPIVEPACEAPTIPTPSSADEFELVDSAEANSPRAEGELTQRRPEGVTA